jgi:glycosyltransferase involved in cell wall biosynthesis
MKPIQNIDIALFLYSLDGGGAERVMANLASNFAQTGLKVDLILVKSQGPYLSLVPPEVRVIELKASKTQNSLWDLVKYLRKEKPTILLSAMHYANEIALWAGALARVPTKVVICEHNTLSIYAKNTSRKVERWTPLFAKLFYPWAHKIIAVSHGVAQDLVKVTGLPASCMQVIYNPVFTPDLAQKAKEPVHHPWFEEGKPPVILGIGRLVGQKDFETLIRAFAQIRQSIPARLMILGSNAGSQTGLEKLIKALGIDAEVALPGFVNNPYSYLARAKVFVLSSRWEGLPLVLVEALAIGTPIVSTDCESGPAEILDHGRYGVLVPVKNPTAMAEAILKVLDGDVPPIDRSWLEQFKIENIAQQYLSTMGIVQSSAV